MSQSSYETSQTEDHESLEYSFSAYFKTIKTENKIISQESISLIEYHLKNGNIHGANAVINATLKNIDDVPINIAVTGESGVGKSSFINALRGVGHKDEGAAEVGIVETTMERTPYKHPKIKTLTLWDLPGIGTMKFPPKDYLEKVKFQEYEFFVIVSATHFTKLELDLAKAIRFMGKNYYFVRTKVDIDLDNEEKCKPHTFDTEKSLQQIRSYCVNSFHQNNMDAPQIFLISNWDLSDYDFPVLMDTLTMDIPNEKHHNLMLSLPNITEAAIDRKRKSMQQFIWLEAFKAGILATVPVVSIFRDDVERLKEKLNHYRFLFGVDDESLEFIAKDLQMPVEQLKKLIKSPDLLKTKKKEALEGKLLKYLKTFVSEEAEIRSVKSLEGSGQWFLQLNYSEYVHWTQDFLGLYLLIAMGQLFSDTFKDEDMCFKFVEYFKTVRPENRIISQKTITSIESHLAQGNIQKASAVITDALREINRIPLNVAVIGESGTGKSSFINAFRGLGHEEEESAPTGVVETTMSRTPYKHPNIPNVIIWDLPGIGTTNFPPKDYLEKMKFNEYDFFIIVSATRFMKNDIDLAKAVRIMKKDFYFVRTKVDIDLEAEKGCKHTFDRENLLQQIRSYCVRNFQENNLEVPPIFLISNKNVSDHDFPILKDILKNKLSTHTLGKLMYFLLNITEAVIDRNHKSMQQFIWLEAFKTGTLATVPVGSMLRDDVEKLKEKLNHF
ncbi:hypothetical protein STEG23_022886 [Scotinomys teguina]